MKLLTLLLFALLISSCKTKTDYQKANDAFEKKDYQKSLNFYQHALNSIKKEDRDIIYRKLGLSYYNLSDNKHAVYYLNKSLELNKNQPEINMLFAKISLKLSNYYGTISSLSKVEDSKEKFLLLSEAYLLANNLHDGMNFLKKALKEIKNVDERVIAKYNFAKKMLNYKAGCKEKYLLFKELEKDIKNNKKFKSQKNDFYKNFYKVLECKKNNKYVDEKIRILNNLLNKKDSYYYNELSKRYIDIRDLKKARELLIESKKINPNQSETIYIDGLLTYYKRDFNSTIGYMNQFLEKNPNSIKAIKILANSQQSLKKYEDAIKNYKFLIKKDNMDLDSTIHLKECYEATGEKEKLKKIRKEIKLWDRKYYK